MEFKDKLLDTYIAFEEELGPKDSIQKLRSQALKTFENLGFPSKKQEAWKYTSLNSLLQSDYLLFPKSEKAVELNQIKHAFLYEIDTYKVVFIDGVHSPFLSDTTHDGLDVCLLSAALSKPKYKKTH